MGLYLAVPIGVVALLIAVSGGATLSREWLSPWQRRHIVRPRLFGWAQLLIAAALGLRARLRRHPHRGRRGRQRNLPALVNPL
ncbi:hypothetical protein [Streptomyces sp. NBC_01207]|uniref:hypothetical protein n=1 Tax=Streptomyces sp. NBC_01207 TaxID=2903772 RepID=UPI002E12CB46|nr:hypothetical protein OG457_07155 [Streptomyces sp. NBC_01207]